MGGVFFAYKNLLTFYSLFTHFLLTFFKIVVIIEQMPNYKETDKKLLTPLLTFFFIIVIIEQTPYYKEKKKTTHFTTHSFESKNQPSITYNLLTFF